MCHFIIIHFFLFLLYIAVSVLLLKICVVVGKIITIHFKVPEMCYKIFFIEGNKGQRQNGNRCFKILLTLE